MTLLYSFIRRYPRHAEARRTSDPVAQRSLAGRSADRQLVAGMLAGNERAFHTFFNTYSALLARFAARRSTLPAAIIEDVVQNTLIKAVRNLRSFRGDASLCTWLCTICRNELANMQRQVARWVGHESIDDERTTAGELLVELTAPEVQCPHVALENASDRNLIVQTLGRLPRSYACALEWKYDHGMSVEEIARMLGITAVAAQSLLARARFAFKASWMQRC